jgi:predicted TPR repeat methyltransferase
LEQWEQRRQGSGGCGSPPPLPEAGADPRLQDLAAREYAIGMMFRKMASAPTPTREAGPPAATEARTAAGGTAATPRAADARDTSPQLEDLGALRALYRERCIRHLASSHGRLRPGHPTRALAAFWLSAVRGGADTVEEDHGGCGGDGGSGADEERHGPGDESDASVAGSASPTAVTRCPPHYVVGLYSTFAPRFDDLLVRGLGYRTPQILRDLVDRSLLAGGGPREFCSGLDLGCGTGLSGMAFRDRVRGWWRGVDLSPEMLDVARRRGRRRNGHGGCYDELIVGDATSPSSYFRDNGDGSAAARPSSPIGTWDLVLACDVLVYLGDLEPVFALVASHLAPGRGAFALSTELLPHSGGGGHGPSPAAPGAGGPVRPPRDYRLQPTGRFAHSVPYLRRLASRFGLGIVATRICPLRRNGGRDVLGCLAVLERNVSR